jgi:hypothetical protein
MALLYETVPTFEDTWIECLGDLGRYRMAIEDDDIRDREVGLGSVASGTVKLRTKVLRLDAFTTTWLFLRGQMRCSSCSTIPDP